MDAYIAAQPETAQAILQQVRRAIREALPSATETISYQIPACKLPGGTVIFFAGWKQHYSLYPATERVVAALGNALSPYEVNKGTIRFPLSEPVPLELIARIATLRAQENAEIANAKSAGPKKKQQ